MSLSPPRNASRTGRKAARTGRNAARIARAAARTAIVAGVLVTALVGLLAAPTAWAQAPAPASATATASETAPPAPTGPIHVQVALWVLDVRDFNLEEGSYAFDGTLELRWTDPRLGTKERAYFEVMNAMDIRADAYGYELEDGWHTMTWRLHGRLRANFDLRAYPFDVHELPISIEHPLLQAGDLVLHAESEWHTPAGLDLRKHRLGPDFSTGDWQLRDVRTSARDVDYGLDEHFSRYTLSLFVARDPLRFFLSDLAPIVVMVLLGLAASLIPADKIDAKLLLTVLALLVAVELQMVAAERLPPVGYLTIVDWTYAFAYLSLAISILQAIFEHRLYAAGNVEGVRRIRIRGTVASTVAFIVPVVWLIASRAG